MSVWVSTVRSFVAATGLGGLLWLIWTWIIVSFGTPRTIRGARAALESSFSVEGEWWLSGKIVDQNLVDHDYFRGPQSNYLSRSLVTSVGSKAELVTMRLSNATIAVSSAGVQIALSKQMTDEVSTGIWGRRGPLGQVLNGRSWRSELPPFPYSTDKGYLAAQMFSTNYFHFITEILPVIIRDRELIESEPERQMILLDSSFAEELLSLAGVRNHVLLAADPSIIRVRDLIAPRMLPWGFISAPMIRRVREVICSSVPEISSPQVVYLAREPSNTRQILNEPEVLAIIREFHPDMEYIVAGRLSVREQVQLCSKARIVIAPHGAQATNLIWSDRLTDFIEIVSEQTANLSIATLAAACGAHVSRISAQTSGALHHHSDVTVDIDSLRTSLVNP